MTILELQAKVSNKATSKKLPSYKKLTEQQLTVLLQVNTGNQQLIVYDNGLATYSDVIGGKIRRTVLSIFNLTLYYEFSDHSLLKNSISDHPEFLNCDAVQILFFCGQDNLDRNTASREAYHAKGSLDISGEYYEGSSNTRNKSIGYDYYDFTEEVINQLEPDDTAVLLKKLRKNMDKLTDKQKEAVKLYFGEEMTYKMIASKLGITRDSAKDRVEGALKKLRKLMS